MSRRIWILIPMIFSLIGSLVMPALTSRFRFSRRSTLNQHLYRFFFLQPLSLLRFYTMSCRFLIAKLKRNFFLELNPFRYFILLGELDILPKEMHVSPFIWTSLSLFFFTLLLFLILVIGFVCCCLQVFLIFFFGFLCASQIRESILQYVYWLMFLAHFVLYAVLVNAVRYTINFDFKLDPSSNSLLLLTDFYFIKMSEFFEYSGDMDRAEKSDKSIRGFPKKKQQIVIWPMPNGPFAWKESENDKTCYFLWATNSRRKKNSYQKMFQPLRRKANFQVWLML